VTRWRLFNIQIPVADDPGKDSTAVWDGLLRAVAAQAGLQEDFFLGQGGAEDVKVEIVRKSFDARPRVLRRTREADGTPLLHFNYVVDIEVPLQDAVNVRRRPGLCEPAPQVGDRLPPSSASPLSAGLPPVAVVGSGPAGLFAALRLAESGHPVTLIERGQPVERRGRDIGAMIHRGVLDADSNFCFGEGGAGTWSDGKLTTRIGRNSQQVRSVLEAFVSFGAPERILVDGKPHLGTDRLVRLLKSLRQRLLDLGVTIHFGLTADRLTIDPTTNAVTGIQCHHTHSHDHDIVQIDAPIVVLAIGHSARDLYASLHEQGVAMSAKEFAVGLRVEHPQTLIDTVQLKEYAKWVNRGKGKVPVADYTVKAGNVFSFCMCPGGQVVPTSMDPSELCVNGMSFSQRNSPWANSGLVTPVTPEELSPFSSHGPLAGVAFQRAWEREAALRGGGDLVAPVQRVTDFMEGRPSAVDEGTFPKSSYRRGVRASSLHDLYPESLTGRLRAALESFDRQLPGFITDQALLHGVETRTSSPVRIDRNPLTLESVNVRGLYLAGEGAGYAGGIVSAAVDGQRIAEQIVRAVQAGHAERDSSP